VVHDSRRVQAPPQKLTYVCRYPLRSKIQTAAWRRAGKPHGIRSERAGYHISY